MTLDDIKALDRDWLTISQMAAFLDVDPQALRQQANAHREALDYLGAVTIGRRTKFWRPAVVRHFEQLTR